MGIKITIDGAKSIEKGIWRAKLSPNETSVFGSCSSRYGPYSVLLLDSKIKYNKSSDTLVFDPSDSRLLNIGSSDQLIILENLSGQTAISESGDEHFLNALPSQLKKLGSMLLSEVRKQFEGELKYHPKSGKYVETPDNFWVVRIQPRDVSFRITVRGRPHMFSKTAHIELKPDMGSYSAFKISKREQIEEAISIIRQACQN